MAKTTGQALTSHQRNLLAAAAMLLAPLAPAFGQDAGNDSAKPEFYASADALIWTRTTPSGPLFVNGGTGATIFDVRDALHLGWTPGPNITLGRNVTDRFSVEGTYLGTYSWGGSGGTALDANIGPVAMLAFPGSTLTFNAGDTQLYDYSSNLTAPKSPCVSA